MTAMATKLTILTILLRLFTVALCRRMLADDTAPAPDDKAKVEEWFNANILPAADRKDTLDPALAAAESAPPKIIKVMQDGSGEFKTIMEAVNSIPSGNTARVIVSIGPGNYTERVNIDRTKPFITFYGDPNDMPVIIGSGTAADPGGTVESATVIVHSDYFVGVNLVVVNSAPRPNDKQKDMQGVALRLSADKCAMYNSKMHGFQDTIDDDDGRHFYKDCYVEGTVDFIWGNGTSIFLNNEIHVISGDAFELMTAQGRESEKDNSGFVFLHCKVTGDGKNDTFLGRAWRHYSRVVYAYTEMAELVKTEGWSNYFDPSNDATVFYGEYKCTGPGADMSGRVPFAKNLTDAEAQPFLNFGFIEASKWLLPPPKL